MLWVGTSGWQYRDWRGRIYPEGLPQRLWLAAYADRFATVEVNNTFYRLPKRPTFAAWEASVPRGFCFACKMSRYLTHVRRMATTEPVDRFLGEANGLGNALGPVLLQLPPTLRCEADHIALDRLAAVLADFPRQVRVAFEPRHESWFTDEVAAVLSAHDVALVWSDRLSQLQTPLWQTASWRYVRLHQGRSADGWSYGDRALGTWVDRIGGTSRTDKSPDAYVYFNNDPGGAAPRDAARFSTLAARAGLEIAVVERRACSDPSVSPR